MDKFWEMIQRKNRPAVDAEKEAARKAAEKEKSDAIAREEKARILGIFNAPGAERNPDTAAHLAYETSVPLADALAILASTDETADHIKSAYNDRVKARGIIK